MFSTARNIRFLHRVAYVLHNVLMGGFVGACGDSIFAILPFCGHMTTSSPVLLAFSFRICVHLSFLFLMYLVSESIS